MAYPLLECKIRRANQAPRVEEPEEDIYDPSIIKIKVQGQGGLKSRVEMKVRKVRITC